MGCWPQKSAAVSSLIVRLLVMGGGGGGARCRLVGRRDGELLDGVADRRVGVGVQMDANGAAVEVV